MKMKQMSTTKFILIVTISLLLASCGLSSSAFLVPPGHPASVEAEEAEGPLDSDTLVLVETNDKPEDHPSISQSDQGSLHEGHASKDNKHGGHHHGH